MKKTSPNYTTNLQPTQDPPTYPEKQPYLYKISSIGKQYPSYLKLFIYHNSYTLPQNLDNKKKSKNTKKSYTLERSIRRSKVSISDYVQCNQFNLWCTFTFDQTKTDRYNTDLCKKHMTNWLSYQKRLSPNLQYLIVSEFHKRCQTCTKTKSTCTHTNRKKAIHFHALINNYTGDLINTKKQNKNKTVYRFKNYTLGFSHAIKLPQDQEQYSKIANYMEKYITKDMPLATNKKRFWTSQNLTKPKHYINPLETYYLQKLVYKHPPTYINDMYEIQKHDIILDKHITNQNQTQILPL